MCKHLLFITILCLSFVAQSQTSSTLIPARANVAAYSNDNDIITNAYRRSPFYYTLSGNWQRSDTDSSLLFICSVNVEKTWKDYSVCLNIRCGHACRLFINGKEVGYADDSRQWNEFKINKFLKYGKTNTFVIEALKHPEGAMLEDQDIPVGLMSDPFILFKNDPGIYDFSVVADFDPNASTGTLSVSCTTVCSKKKGKYYLEMEVLDPKGHRLDRMGKWVVFSGSSDEVVDITRSWPGIEPWTAETPALYTMILRLRDQDMEIEETVGATVGFRTVSVRDRRLFVNGKPVILKPVSYGMLNVTEEQMENDIVLMKRNNINAVHTTKYSPLDRKFYELCDKYGLYVIPDANLNPTSRRGQVVSVDKEYVPLFERRIENMYASLRNHTSVVVWSLGPCRDNGICMTSAFRRIHQLDKTRPALSQLPQSVDFDIPEFEDINEIPVWSTSNDKLLDLRHKYAPVKIELSKLSSDEAGFIVTNCNDFISLSSYNLQYTVYSNKRNNIISGDLTVSESPHGSEKVDMLLPPNLEPGEQLYIRFDLSERGISRHNKKNTNATQTILSMRLDKCKGKLIPNKAEGNALVSSADSSTFSVNNPVCSISVDRQTSSIRYTNGNGRTVVIPPVAFDNHTVPQIISTEQRVVDSNAVSVDVVLRYKNTCDIRQTATLFSSSELLLEYTVAPNSKDAGMLSATPMVVIEGNKLPADTVYFFGPDRAASQYEIYGSYNIPVVAAAQSRGNTSWCAIGSDKPLYVRQLESDFGFKVADNNVAIVPTMQYKKDNNNICSFRLLLSDSVDQLLGTSYTSYSAPCLTSPAIVASSPRFSQPMAVTITSPDVLVEHSAKKKPRQPAKQTAVNVLRYTTDGSDPTAESPLYNGPFVIERTTMVKAAVFTAGKQNSFTSVQQFNYDHISSTAFNRKPNTPYNNGVDTILFDGYTGTIEKLSRGWLGFSGEPPAITVELASDIDVESLNLRFAHSPATWAFAPVSISAVLFDSNDNPIDTIQANIPFDPSLETEDSPRIVEIAVSSTSTASRLTKRIIITPSTIGRIPEWHRAKGLNPWLLTDEIKVIERIKQ